MTEAKTPIKDFTINHLKAVLVILLTKSRLIAASAKLQLFVSYKIGVPCDETNIHLPFILIKMSVH